MSRTIAHMNPLNEVTTKTPKVPRFTTRLVILEEPAIVELMNALARHNGRSLGAEVRTALRKHLENR
jgi:hypothetical protein